jgi:hypothetical protein
MKTCASAALVNARQYGARSVLAWLNFKWTRQRSKSRAIRSGSSDFARLFPATSITGAVRLLDGSAPVIWRQVARDGADLPPQQSLAGPARTRVDVGITKDFQFTPTKPGELILEVDLRVPGHATRVPIRVR